MMKKMASLFLSLALVLSGVFAFAPAAQAAGHQVRIEEISYEGNGRVEVEFEGKVAYKNLQLTVKDNTGKTYTTTVRKRDNDELDFTINNFKAGRTYTCTFSGLKARGSGGSGKYCTLRCKVKVPAAAQLSIQKTSYKGNGKVEVDFAGKVSWKNAKVTVKDSSGNSYTARITGRDSDELDFRVAGIKAGKSYTYTISGVKCRNAGSYCSISGSFKTPKASTIVIEEIDYDDDDGELSVEFQGQVDYNNLNVTVKDSAGASYPVHIKQQKSDELELYVEGLSRGAQYTLNISGIKNRCASSTTSVSKTFYATDD